MKFSKDFLRVVLAICVIVVIIFGYNLYRATVDKRNKDVLFGIANKLGYTQQQEINFDEFVTWGPDASYDILVLSYFTNMSLDDFSQSVENFGYKREYYFPDNMSVNNNFLSSLNLNVSSEKRVSLGEITSDYRGVGESPHVTEWTLSMPDGRQLTIDYATSNDKHDPWIFQGKSLQSSIVKIDYRIR